MTKSVTKDNYLKISYNEDKLPRSAYPNKLSLYLLNNFFLHSGIILDVGCGRGEYLEAFRSLGFEVNGVDISPMVKKLAGDFNVAQCDFENDVLPYQENSFDFIFSKSVIEHLHYPEKLVDELFRILRPKGKAVLMCPSWVHTYWGPFYIDHTHVTPFTLPSLCQLVELSGFEVVYAEHFVQLPILWKIPFLKIISELTAMLPIPFRPLYKTALPEILNKWVRFSKEKMLLVVGEKK